MSRHALKHELPIMRVIRIHTFLLTFSVTLYRSISIFARLEHYSVLLTHFFPHLQRYYVQLTQLFCSSKAFLCTAVSFFAHL